MTAALLRVRNFKALTRDGNAAGVRGTAAAPRVALALAHQLLCIKYSVYCYQRISVDTKMVFAFASDSPTGTALFSIVHGTGGGFS